ncbi:MAG: hypothetical protein AAGH90_00060 [Pseudomonadota bacterium]
MILKSGIASVLAIAFCTQMATATCKAPSDKYDLIDLGDVVEGQAESRAVAIDKRGRIVVRTVPPGIGQPASEYLIERNGKAKRAKNPDEVAIRETQRLVGNKMRLTDYTLVTEGFLPARATTLVDSKGGEIDIVDYCKLEDGDGWDLDTFLISDNGEQTAALFESDTAFRVASCTFDAPATVLFETDNKIELGGINNDGQIGGLEKNGDGISLWRWSDGDRLNRSLPEELLDAEVSAIDDDGRVFALATGVVVNPAIYLSTDDQLSPIIMLPGDGWDVNWLTISPCGTVVGEATYTNFASFIQLPEKEQRRMRENFAEFWQYALERESALFVWSEGDQAGRFLGAAAKDTRNWNSIRLTAINEDGVIIGHADNEDGETRAIKLVPAKS